MSSELRGVARLKLSKGGFEKILDKCTTAQLFDSAKKSLVKIQDDLGELSDLIEMMNVQMQERDRRLSQDDDKAEESD